MGNQVRLGMTVDQQASAQGGVTLSAYAVQGTMVVVRIDLRAQDARQAVDTLRALANALAARTTGIIAPQ